MSEVDGAACVYGAALEAANAKPAALAVLDTAQCTTEDIQAFDRALSELPEDAKTLTRLKSGERVIRCWTNAGAWAWVNPDTGVIRTSEEVTALGG